MKERPILFSAPMVRAILSGAKTQTRRIIKPQPIDSADDPIGAYTVDGGRSWRCPHGRPGDRLWVREAFIHEPADYCWKPSIHMPRWASRITLEITDVRVERLQDISEADAVAEGCEPIRPELVQDGMIVRQGRSAVEEFRLVWEQIHGGGSWEKNPWVWVIKFKKLAQQEAA